MSIRAGDVTRRKFLHRLAATGVAGGVLIAGTKASGRVLGANETIHVGVAGLNKRGNTHIQQFGGMKNVQITYLIDPDSTLFASRSESVKRLCGVTPRCVQDIRKALDDKELDVITVATCNHWHALITIWACQAGKDVYVEKPCSHNVFEGRQCVAAARKYRRIVQHGTQNRSRDNLRSRAEEIASGKLGRLLISAGRCFKRRPSIGFQPHQEPPETLDFDIWLGPAPKQPFHRNLVHYNWHWFWDTGNGDIGNQGVHEMDIARWMIPGATLPKSVISFGGRFGYQDQGETPNTQVVIFDYGETMLVFEVRGLPTKGGVGNSQLFDDKSPATPRPVTSFPGVKSPIGERGPGDIWHNFIHCVRTRREEDLDAHILEAHYSSALCHLANISYRLGQDVPFSQQSKAFGDDKLAYEYFAAMKEHLKENEVPLDGATYRLGRRLLIDAEKEQIIGDAEANQMLRREYRPPFVVPEVV